MSARIKRHLNLHIIDLLVPPGDWPAREVKSIFLSSISAAVRLRDETGISAGGPPDDPPDGLEGGCERENAKFDSSIRAPGAGVEARVGGGSARFSLAEPLDSALGRESNSAGRKELPYKKRPATSRMPGDGRQTGWHRFKIDCDCELGNFKSSSNNNR